VGDQEFQAAKIWNPSTKPFELVGTPKSEASHHHSSHEDKPNGVLVKITYIA
jgi:hypothetical protein